MAQVTYNEEEQVFESVEVGNASDPIAEGVEDFLQQIEESEVASDDILPSTDEEGIPLEDMPVDAGVDEEPQEGYELEVPDSMEIPEEIPPYYLPSYLDTYSDPGMELYSSVPSNAAFTPTAWQVNLASARQLGEHYLMYADRVYYSGSSSYWHYFLVLGDGISFDNGVYTYADCDVYSYYSYAGTVYYDRDLGSGSLDGNGTLVYSDLYFDYVGVEPAVNSYPFIVFALLLFVFVAIVIGGRKRV